MMADRAFLRGIGRINVDHRNTGYSCLVVDILPELIEAPVMLFASLSLWNRYPLSYTREIFQHDSRGGVYGLRNQLLGDAMVNVSMEPGIPYQKAFSDVVLRYLYRNSEDLP